MNSTNGTRMLRTMIIAAGLLVAGSGAAQAALLASGPVQVNDSNYYSCSVVNVGTKDISVKVVVTIDGASPGSGTSQTCSALAPNAVCTAANDAGFAKDRFCTVTTNAKRVTRGTFCDTTTGICVPVQ